MPCGSWFGQDEQDWQDLGQVLGEADYVDWIWGARTQRNGVQRNGAENLVDPVHPVRISARFESLLTLNRSDKLGGRVRPERLIRLKI